MDSPACAGLLGQSSHPAAMDRAQCAMQHIETWKAGRPQTPPSIDFKYSFSLQMNSAEDSIYSSQVTTLGRPGRRREGARCCTALTVFAMEWPTAALQIMGNNILISQDCTHHQTLLVFAEVSYELSAWAFWCSSDSHYTILRPEMLSGNRNSCPVLCARCPHHCPDRTLILKLIPQTFHSSSTQLPRFWVNPKHICQGKRFKTCHEPKHLERGSSAPHNSVQARKSLAWSHIPNPGITQPGNTTDTPCTSLECHWAFMFCGTKQGKTSWDYFTFPSFSVFQLPQQFQGRQQYLPAKTKINFTFSFYAKDIIMFLPVVRNYRLLLLTGMWSAQRGTCTYTADGEFLEFRGFLIMQTFKHGSANALLTG